MIGIEGEYIFIFSNNTKENFIEPEDLIKFISVEEDCLKIPSFQLNFYSDLEQLHSFNEGAVIYVTHGMDFNSLIHTAYVINRSKIAYKGHNAKALVQLTGYIDIFELVVVPKYYISKEPEPFSNVLEELWPFRVKTEISKEKQIWINPEYPIYNYIRDNYLYMKYENGYPHAVIQADGTLLVPEMRNQAASWTFSNRGQGILYKTDVNKDSKQVLKQMNKGGIYEFSILHLEENLLREFKTSFISPFSTEEQLISTGLKYSRRYQTDNTYIEKHEVFNNNVASLRYNTAVNTTVSIFDKYYKFGVLDFSVLDGPGMISGTPTVSGLYYISRVSRMLTNQSLNIELRLSRGGQI